MDFSKKMGEIYRRLCEIHKIIAENVTDLSQIFAEICGLNSLIEVYCDFPENVQKFRIFRPMFSEILMNEDIKI